MTLRRLKHRDVRPFKEGWPYDVEYKGKVVTIIADHFIALVDKVSAFMELNKITPPAGGSLAEVIEDQICGKLPQKSSRTRFGTTTIRTLAGLTSGTQLLMSLTFRHKPEERFVSQDEAERRAAICAGGDGQQRCPFNEYVQCIGCEGLYDLVRMWFKNRTTTRDEDLMACTVCGCLNTAQVHVRPEILKEITKPVIAAMYPSDHCWKAEILRGHHGQETKP